MSHLRIIDYRNAKYQGQTKNNMRNGFGIMMDDSFTLIIGNWAKNILNGPCVIVYPESIVFYGNYLNGYPDGLCIFQLQNMINLYCVFQSKRQRQNQKSWPRVNSKLVLTMQQSKVLIEANFNREKYDQIEIITDSSYTTEQQKFKGINRILEKQVKQTMQQGWLRFLKLQLCQYSKQLEVTRALRGRNNQITIGFKKGDTLGGTFSDGLFSLPISIGFFKNFHIFKDIGRKYVQTKNGKIIQQGIYNVQLTKNNKNLSHSNVSSNASNVHTYHQQGQKRPIHVIKAIQTYFKQSITFNNSFANLAQIYKAERVCFKVQSAILMNKLEHYAQVQLQQLSPKSDAEINEKLLNKAIEQYQKQKNAVFEQWTLQQVKNELQQVIKRRNKIGKINHFNIQNFQSLSTSRKLINQNSSPSRESIIRKNRDTDRIKQKTTNSRVKTVQFSPQFSRKTRNNGTTPQRSDKNGQKNGQKSRSKGTRSPNRYRYVPIQSLDLLTKDYEDIQKKLLKETPKAKKNNGFGRKYIYNSKLRDYSYEKIDKSPLKSQSKSKRSPYKYKY